MANIHDCIQRALDAGEVDQSRAAEARRVYDELLERYRTIMPEHAAEVRAAADLREATKAQTAARMHKTVAQLQAMTRIRDLVDSADDPAIALRQFLEHSEGSGFSGESVRTLRDAYVRSINAGLRDVLRETGQNIAGRSRAPARLENLLRELHQESTGDARARQLADAVRKQQERMRQLFNAHGGDIGKLDDFGVHHTHDAMKIRKAGRDAWIAGVTPRLDWTRIVDRTTGQPFVAEKGALPAPEAAAPFLTEVYESIATRGWKAREPSLNPAGKALYNRRAEARQLHFKSGSDWLAYNKSFGAADPFSSMIGGLHGMARDVALMRVLGPNPRMGLEFATQVAEKRAATMKSARLEARVKSQSHLASNQLAHLDGSANTPANEAWAAFFSGGRNVLTSIHLGAALLSSPTDLATISVAAKVMGMNPSNVLARSSSLMASHATRETAARMGYVADSLADAGSVAKRYLGDTWSPEVTERLSRFTIQASGLAFWTDMNRIAFQMEFAGFLADNAKRAFDDIDAPLRKMFQDRGITAADWDHLRAEDSLFRAPNGADFLSPIHWLNSQTVMPADQAEGLAMRLQMAIEEQMEFAIPSVSLEMTARFQGGTQPGTIAGEIMRSGTMYKSFAFSLTLNQYRRIAAIPTLGGRWKYAASILVLLTLGGAVGIQAKELARGRDPRPMTDLSFWMAALLQGGGLGIFGDFIASETNRFGGGLGETLAGPVVSTGADVLNLVASNAKRAVEGDDLLLGRDVANFVRRNTPVASSLWYGRLAFDRLVADRLQAVLDPEAETQWRRQARRAAREYGTRQWWSSGAMAPERPPDISNAVRQR